MYKHVEEQEFIQDWIDGDLVEARGDNIYAKPLELLIESNPDDFAEMLDAWRRGDDEEVLRIAKKMCPVLENNIRLVYTFIKGKETRGDYE